MIPVSMQPYSGFNSIGPLKELRYPIKTHRHFAHPSDHAIVVLVMICGVTGWHSISKHRLSICLSTSCGNPILSSSCFNITITSIERGGSELRVLQYIRREISPPLSPVFSDSQWTKSAKWLTMHTMTRCWFTSNPPEYEYMKTKYYSLIYL